MRSTFDCEVTAAFLESGRMLANVANAAAIAAGVGCWTLPRAGAGLLGLSLVGWAVESWFALRVAIDRSLFRTLAAHPEHGPDWLDQLLVDWKMVDTAKPRDLAARSRGALRLWRRQSIALTGQLVLLAAALILRMVNG